jgi:hypothetical protein
VVGASRSSSPAAKERLRIDNSAADWRCTSGSPACCGSWRLEAGDDVLHLGLDLLGVIGVELHGPEVGEELS